MAIDREKIFAALFDRLAAIKGIRFSSRTFKPLDQVQPMEKPALFLVKGGETAQQRKGLPPRWSLEAYAHIYVSSADNPAESPSAQLNRIIQAVDEALEMSDAERDALERTVTNPADLQELLNNNFGTTLGGLCSHAWIAGTIETDEGVLGDQAAAVIPIEILTA